MKIKNVMLNNSEFDLPSSNYIFNQSQISSCIYNFYLYGTISEFNDNVVEMIGILNNSTENDVINIFINTQGGALNVTASIIHSISRCAGSVITHADGDVFSAGTMIFFSGHGYVVNPYSRFMLHDSAGGVNPYGKSNENIKMLNSSSNLIKKIAKDLYSPFFSQEEIDRILSGEDMYCDAEEIIKRIEDSDKSKEAVEE